MSILKKVACIGAGTVGRSWALVFARAGYQVSLYDARQQEMREQTLPQARSTLELMHQAGFLQADKDQDQEQSASVDAVLARIEFADSIQAAVQGAVYVQESVREDLQIKRDVFAEIAQHASSDCVLASSTSAIKGSEFLTHFEYPRRALVAHPVNPPALIPLVELCGTPQTSAETLSKAKEFLTQAGMKPVTLNKEIDGFLLNRLQYTLVAEAMHLVGEGYCTAADIDRVLTDGLALRWASAGPFEVAHLNAEQGFLGFVEQLGPMMKRMGADAKTDYQWGDELAEKIHQDLVKKTPVDQIPEKQLWRDGKILATRKMQGLD